jgi:hypothetical protein
MMSDLKIEDLYTVLFSNIDEKMPCVIYMGIGTHCNDPLRWDVPQNRCLNQQFPCFLHDWKISNLDVPIKIILFDAETKSKPYIVTDRSSFCNGSFVQDDKFSNVYNSEFGIQVYSFPTNVKWKNDRYNLNGSYDITELLLKIVQKVSACNYLFFFHEFTGRNPQDLEIEIKKMFDYDDQKICIDISRGRDLSCCVNFYEPENYPLIEKDEINLIKWLNPKNISFDKKRLLIDNFSKGHEYAEYIQYLKESNELSNIVYSDELVFNFYIYKQIMNVNKNIYNICNKIFFTMKNLSSKFKSFDIIDEKNIIELNILQLVFSNFSLIYSDILTHLFLLKENTIKDDEFKISYSYKLTLMDKLKTVLVMCMSSLNIDDTKIIDLMKDFERESDLSKFRLIFKNFCMEKQLIL